MKIHSIHIIYYFIGIRELGNKYQRIPQEFEPGELIYRTDNEYQTAILGGDNIQPITFIKPIATCAEAPPNTALPTTSFYGVATTLTMTAATTISIPPPPSPQPTLSTILSPQTSPATRNIGTLLNRRRRRSNPFNSNAVYIVNQGRPLLTISQYRYISEETRSEASEEDDSMEIGSDESDAEFNFDAQY